MDDPTEQPKQVLSPPDCFGRGGRRCPEHHGWVKDQQRGSNADCPPEYNERQATA